jgi:tetratricopeptide (TPR) repeat protein
MTSDRLLDENKRLSQSQLWKIQDDYYVGQGIAAWNESVPFFITNSTFLAECYGDLILGFLSDYLQHLDTSAPVYIAELSAGTGRLSYYLLREIARKRKHYPALASLDLKFVMTDITDNHVQFWKQHERLAPYIESGMLDFAVFRPETESAMTLVNAGKTLGPQDFVNPLLIVANYLLDTVRHDLFRVTAHQLEEGLVSVYRAPNASEATDAVLTVDDIEITLSYQPATPDPYYADEYLNRILQEYTQALSEGEIIFPIGSFHCINNLQALTNHNVAFFVSDKGYTSLEAMALSTEHHFAAHGAFSYPVNFQALDRYFEQLNGFSLHTHGTNFKLKTACYFDLPQKDTPFERIHALFAEKLDRNNPVNSLLEVANLAMFFNPGQPHELIIDMMLGILRATYFDPQVFSHCAPRIAESIHLISWPQTQELRYAMQQTWGNFYFFPGECNIPILLSQIHACLGEHAESIAFLEESIRLFGPQDRWYYLMGRAYEALLDTEQATHCYNAALLLNPSLTQAQQRLITLEA